MAKALPKSLRRRFEALIFDWDGTAVPDRASDASELRKTIERLCQLGMDIAVVTGTNADNVDSQLKARPPGPGQLCLGLNRGSEVFVVGPEGPNLIYRRVTTKEENEALDRASELLVSWLDAKGLKASIIANRLNRRKVDLIPLVEWADPPKARIGELLAAVQKRLQAAGISSLEAVVALAEDACSQAGLENAKITSDAKHVEIGLTDKSDSARWLFSELTHRGISPVQTIVFGDEWGTLGGLSGSDTYLSVPEYPGAQLISVGREPEGVPEGVLHVPGGPDTFLHILQDQLHRRQEGELPCVAAEHAWELALDDEGLAAPEIQSTLSDGTIGTNGFPVCGPDERHVRANGVYVGEGARTMLLSCPTWSLLNAQVALTRVRRVLDMRGGLLEQHLGTDAGPVDAVLFSSLARPGTTVLRAKSPEVPSEPIAPPGGVRTISGEDWIRVEGQGGVVAAGNQIVVQQKDHYHVDRVVAYVIDPHGIPKPKKAVAKLNRVRDAGFERLLCEHRGAWADRWRDCNIEIEGDPELDRAVRFCLFHLISSAATKGESAIGAGALTGDRYKGHVFWDTDIFVLPFLAATCPKAARSILEYRLRRLDASRQNARELGYDGARFAWESACGGEDVTPSSGRDGAGKIIRIRTGEMEEHITGDVAWAATHYDAWTGERFISGEGRDLIVETARYWASRVRRERGGDRRHIYGVIGPDEYHEPSDDNAYTNVLARWNLRQAASITPSVHLEEAEHWLEIAEHLSDGYNEETRIYEQCAGYYGLEPVIIANLTPNRPADAEALLGGHARLQSTQVIKQADVLMLHHLLPEETAPGSLEANLRFYEPRCAHASSLSPSVHAALLARVGDFKLALDYLRMSAFFDLQNIKHEHSDGLHLATLGGVWQAIVFGFAGVRPGGGCLNVDPRLPDEWTGLVVRVRYRGSRVTIRIRHGQVDVRSDLPIPVRFGGREEITQVGPESHSFNIG